MVSTHLATFKNITQGKRPFCEYFCAITEVLANGINALPGERTSASISNASISRLSRCCPRYPALPAFRSHSSVFPTSCSPAVRFPDFRPHDFRCSNLLSFSDSGDRRVSAHLLPIHSTASQIGVTCPRLGFPSRPLRPLR
jgi:hypothetical protein